MSFKPYYTIYNIYYIQLFFFNFNFMYFFPNFVLSNPVRTKHVTGTKYPIRTYTELPFKNFDFQNTHNIAKRGQGARKRASAAAKRLLVGWPWLHLMYQRS